VSSAPRSTLVLRFYPPTEALLVRSPGEAAQSSVSVAAAVASFRAGTVSAVCGGGEAPVAAAATATAAAAASPASRPASSYWSPERVASRHAKSLDSFLRFRDTFPFAPFPIRAVTGETCTLMVKVSATVDTIMQMIAAEGSIPPGQQRLYWGNKLLKGGRLLSHYGIEAGATLDVTHYVPDPPSLPGVPIFVKTLTGNTLTLNVDRSDTVADVKKKIEASEEFPAPVALQRLIFAGQELEDERTLAECEIRWKYTLFLGLHLPPTSSGGPSTEAEVEDEDEGGGKDSSWLPTAIVSRRAVSLASFAGDSGHVTINMLTGSSFTLTVRPTTTVLELITMIEEREGVPVEQHRLVYLSNQRQYHLESKMTLADYGIGKDDTIYRMSRMRGD
jgi:hypothetical protein